MGAVETAAGDAVSMTEIIRRYVIRGTYWSGDAREKAGPGGYDCL